MKKRIAALFFAVILIFALCSCGVDLGYESYPVGTAAAEETRAPEMEQTAAPEEQDHTVSATVSSLLDQDGVYTTKEDVALYLWQYHCLPRNFMTKKEAKALGWTGGGLGDYAPGSCIGGDRFGNYEGVLPELEGLSYYECDIDTLGADSRGAKRLVYREDFQAIYYTEDHYETFEVVFSALPEEDQP